MNNLDKIETKIYFIREQKVMLDIDLAALYGIETKRFNEQVKRNLERFPDDFMFIPNSSELASLRSQIATLEGISAGNYIFKYPPKLFTELGVAMLSSVLNSPQSISINIVIMRTFVRLRKSFQGEKSMDSRVSKLEKGTHELFNIVFERMDSIEEIVFPNISPKRKKIGLKTEEN